MAKYKQSVFVPCDKKKYIGSKKFCIARSSWERKYMEHLEHSIDVKQWCSECVVVPYSFHGKTRRYYPDFLVVYESGVTVLVEIKPLRETKPPRQTKNKSKKTMLYEQYTFAKNQKKWEAAVEFCRKKGWKFQILTEKSII